MSTLATLRAEVAGIPAFVVPDGPRVPVAGLTFRVGRADETAATAGLSHLVEHLALPATTATPFDFNRTVDTLFTSFFASGDLHELREFLASTGGLCCETFPSGDSRPSGGSSSRRRARGAPEARARLSLCASARWVTGCRGTSSTGCGGWNGRRSSAGRRHGSLPPLPPSGSPAQRSRSSTSTSSSSTGGAARNLRCHGRSTI